MAHFASDNWAGAHPKIIQAIAESAGGFLPAYGHDDLAKAVEDKFAEVFETPLTIMFVATGTAANAFALSLYTPPHGAILCHQAAHINTREYNAQSVFTGGAQMIGMPGGANKISAETLDQTLRGLVQQPIKPATMSITQSTEVGSVYSLKEISAITATAHARGLKTHMDGARFTNALVHLGCTPAEMTWKGGVDVMSFGGNKNGCAVGDAVIVFNASPELKEQMLIRRTRAGHGFPKMRYLAAQYLAYFEHDLWLALARHANAQAQKLSENLTVLGLPPLYPVQANQVFVTLTPTMAERLKENGHTFYLWHDGSYRLVTSYLTSDTDIDTFCRDMVTAQKSLAA